MPIIDPYFYDEYIGFFFSTLFVRKIVYGRVVKTYTFFVSCIYISTLNNCLKTEMSIFIVHARIAYKHVL